MLATPKSMGYLRSNRYPLHFVLIRLTNAMDVSTPSATSVVEARMSSIVSPFPSRYPNFLFLDNGPKHVPKVSPTPDKPARVLGFAPKVNPSRLISPQPLVTRPLMALVPRPSPSHIPAESAITFLTAPPISTPITSFVVKTRNESSDSNPAKSLANIKSSDAITTAVATPSQISLAKDGPDKKAYGRSSPRVSRKMSFIKPSDDVSIPFEALRIGVPCGMLSLIPIRKSLLYWQGTV
mmetsp:Transcript_37036/g.42256  ORF Transcript_37036/g.42256 Transcript_37036/m.42256 type:complete len:238 (-) Transcript_37036:554-1267(-)